MRKDYYVYALIDSDGCIRYFGEGRLRRQFASYKRTKSYSDILQQGGETIILYDNLTKAEARSKETFLIKKFIDNSNPNVKLINKRLDTTSVVNDLSYEIANEYFEINKESPSGLVFKSKYSRNVVVGKMAGSLDNNYWRVSIFGARYVVHRIVWMLHNKKNCDSSLVVNHIDGNPSNNCPSNLEMVSQSINSLKKRIKEKDFPQGLARHAKYSIRAVVWLPDGKSISKSFSEKKYGYEQALGMAMAWRNTKLEEINFIKE